jgi:hypothetical protein
LAEPVDLPRIITVVLLLAVAPAIAQGAGKRSVVVEVSPAADWRAEALSRALTADLADDRLALRAPPGCRPCDDGALRAAGVELVVRATLAAGKAALGYELRPLWPGAPAPVRGAIALRGLDRASFAGVLRDQLHRLARATSDDSGAADTSGAELPAVGDIAWALAVALGVLASPFALGAVRTRRFAARAAAGRTLAGVATLGAVALAVAAAAPANARGALFAAGGVAWGAFAAVTIPVVFPAIGLGRVDVRELWRLLAGWTALVVQRTVLLALVYAPVAIAVVAASRRLDVPGGDAVWFALVLPLGLLLARQWVRLGIAVAADALDGALVDASADAAAWQDAVRGTFVGYLRRNGLPLDDALIERVRVLPVGGDEVCVYGGGATHARIAIPRKMLELALAPLGRPHDYVAPRVSTLHWMQWNAGLVMATEAGAAVATRDQRQPRETTSEGETPEAREHIGELPTLAGIIDPLALDRRSSYRPHEDPAWLDWDAGDEHDGTDPNDRDFLFGVLVHAFAQIQRHGDRVSTLALVLGRGRFTARAGRLLDRLPDAIGDDHAAIAGARHHLVQYLGWEAFEREDLLTKRAYAPELEAMSRRVLAACAHAEAVSAATPAAACARKRLVRLAGLIHGAAPARARWPRLALAGALVAGAGLAVVAIANAVRYHAIYEDRLRSESRGEPRSEPRSEPRQDSLENHHGKD